MQTPDFHDDEPIDFVEINPDLAAQDHDASPLEQLAETLCNRNERLLGIPAELHLHRHSLYGKLFSAEEYALKITDRPNDDGQRKIDVRDMHMRIFRIIREDLHYVMHFWERAKAEEVDIGNQCTSIITHFREVLLDIQDINMEFIPVNVLPYLQESTVRDMQSLRVLWEPYETTPKKGETSYQVEQTIARISNAT